MTSGEAVKNAHHTARCSFGDHRASVIFRIARMHDDRQTQLCAKCKLLCKCAALLRAGRIVVMVVEAALADCNRA